MQRQPFGEPRAGLTDEQHLAEQLLLGAPMFNRSPPSFVPALFVFAEFVMELSRAFDGTSGSQSPLIALQALGEACEGILDDNGYVSWSDFQRPEPFHAPLAKYGLQFGKSPSVTEFCLAAQIASQARPGQEAVEGHAFSHPGSHPSCWT